MLLQLLLTTATLASAAPSILQGRQQNGTFSASFTEFVFLQMAISHFD